MRALRVCVAIGSVFLATVGGLAAHAEDLPRVDLGALRILDVRGTTHALGADPRRPGAVFVFISTECPISRQYVPELNRLAGTATEGHLPFYGVLSDATLTRRAAAAFIEEFRIAFPVLFDASGELAESFRPEPQFTRSRRPSGRPARCSC